MQPYATQPQVVVVEPDVFQQGQTGGPYLHRHKGTIHKLYYGVAGLVIVIVLVQVAVYLAYGFPFVSLIPVFIWGILVCAFILPQAKGCEYLEFRDEGAQLVIEFGPWQIPCMCGLQRTTILYSEMREVSEVIPTCCTYGVKYIQIERQKGIKFMHSGGLCDNPCCDGCCRGGQPVDYKFYQIQLQTGRCLYDKVRVTINDVDGFRNMLKSKGVRVPDEPSPPCCCF